MTPTDIEPGSFAGNLLRVIPYGCYSAAFNMAADEYFFRSRQTVLRFYGWSVPTLSFGRYIKKRDEIDLLYCAAQSIPTVDRLTGGKTVFHDLELTYAFTAPTGVVSKSVLEAYRFISSCLIAGLARLGIECEMEPGKTTDDSSVCFREISGYEVTCAGKKLIGSAQHRNASGMLQHGSILLDLRPSEWIKIWRGKLSPKQIQSRVTTLKEITGAVPDTVRLTQALTLGFEQQGGFQHFEKDFETTEREQIAELSKKYGTDPPLPVQSA